MTNISLFPPTADFGIQLLKKELKAHKGENILLSPAGVSIVLAMTMNGARGTTQKEIQTALSLPDYGNISNITITNLSYANLLAELSNQESLGGVELSIANAIWANQDVTFRPEFLDAVRSSIFHASVTSADLQAPATLQSINKWVSDKTKTRIPKILDDLSPASVMFLLNAVYFKGKWNVGFDKDLTQNEDFHATTGIRKHPMMKRTDDLVYGENFQAVKLPFGDNKRINLYVFLPYFGISVEKFVDGFTKETLTHLAKRNEKSEGTLLLPRFEIEYDVQLNNTLKMLGMASAFEPDTANFSGMSDGGICISGVKHKTFAKFDEEGGEAAATALVEFMVGCALDAPSPGYMRCDRPFVIALYDEGTGTLLFIGVVNDPK